MKNQLLFKPVLSFFFSMLCFIMLHAQTCPPIIEWQKSLGGSLDDAASSVVVTADSGYVIAGYTVSNDSDVSGNNGTEDFWVVKLASDGSIIWQAALGGPNFEASHALIQTSDGGYIVAGSSRSATGQVSGNNGQQDFWIVKLDSAGNIIWENSLGGSGNDIAYAVNQTLDGGYIVAGETSSNDFDVTNNYGLNDYWVVKLDTGGNLVWQKNFGGTGFDEAHAIEQTTDGGYMVAGFTTSNNIDVSGNHGLYDYWVVKLDSAGTLTWQQAFGGPKNDEAFSAHQVLDGGFIIAGTTFSNAGNVSGNHGASDFWVVKLDSTGTLVWQKALGGSDFDGANWITQTPDGGYVTAGYTTSNDSNVTLYHGAVDYWVTKQDSDGNLVWQKTMGGTNFDGAFSVEQTPDSGYIVAGYTSSDNDDVTGNNGLNDFWVVKLLNAPNTLLTYFADTDGDSYGDPGNFLDTISCLPPPGYVTDNNDCNDADSTIHPNGVEVCNGIDDNCNAIIEDGVIFITYYLDADNDLYGVSSNTVSTCNGAPSGYVSTAGDCNDADATIHPNAIEICNGFDEDCDGVADDGLVFITYYFDGDGDLYGIQSNSVSTCNGPPAGYVINGNDCDDTDPSIHPLATEICNNIDDDCDTFTDDGLVFVTYYVDADNDTYGNPLSSVSTCDGAPAGYVSDSTDCDDANPNINPGVLEISNNGIDDNCNGTIDEFGVGVAEFENSSSFIISPNPATNLVTLQLQLHGYGSFNTAIAIKNVLGQAIVEMTSPCIDGILREEIVIDQKFSQGIYLVEVNGDNLKWSRLLMIAK